MLNSVRAVGAASLKCGDRGRSQREAKEEEKTQGLDVGAHLQGLAVGLVKPRRPS